jgi:CRISPR/Cas system-associated endoribonuclease Cas2
MIHIPLLRYDQPYPVTFTLNQDTATNTSAWLPSSALAMDTSRLSSSAGKSHLSRGEGAPRYALTSLCGSPKLRPSLTEGLHRMRYLIVYDIVTGIESLDLLKELKSAKATRVMSSVWLLEDEQNAAHGLCERIERCLRSADRLLVVALDGDSPHATRNTLVKIH